MSEHEMDKCKNKKKSYENIKKSYVKHGKNICQNIKWTNVKHVEDNHKTLKSLS